MPRLAPDRRNGLPADATADKVIAAVKALAADGAKSRTAHSAMAKRLGLPEDATIVDLEQGVVSCLDAIDETAQVLGVTGPVNPAQLAACAKALATKQGQTADPDPTKHVPMEQFQAVASRLKALEDSQAKDKAAAAVAEAMQAGKVIPSTKAWAMAYASRDPAGFAAYVAAMPAIVTPGQEGPSGTPSAGPGQMDEAALAVCSQLGIPAEDYKRNIDKEVG